MENRVSLQRCEDYQEENIRIAIEKIFADFGGIGNVVKAGDKVYLKCNFVSGKEPQKAVTTHPMVTKVVAKMCKECGATVSAGDSSGGLYVKNYMQKIYKITGTESALAEIGVGMNDNYETQTIDVENGKVTKQIEVTSSVWDADVVINLGKMKTHTLTRYTGLVKNLFGVIPGLKKVSVHGEYQEIGRFFDYLLDINVALKNKVQFHIMDAITCMEGDGPTAGTPKDVFAIFGGKNAFACDYVGTSIMGSPSDFPQNDYAQKRGLLNPQDIEVVGEDITSLACKFEIPAPRPDANLFKIGKYPKFVANALRKFTITYPTVAKKDCRGCKKCAEHCPPQAIDMTSGKAKFDYDKCIRCFCCQELCPFGVIKIKKPLGAKILAKRKK